MTHDATSAIASTPATPVTAATAAGPTTAPAIDEATATAAPVPRRGLGKKLSLIGAASSLTCGFFTFGATLWFWMTNGKPIITGSLGATTFFFVTAAIVLYEMSRPQPPLPTLSAEEIARHQHGRT